MKNGYNIFWTDFALKELENTIEYIEQNWSEKELKNLAEKLEETLNLISKNPDIFQVSEFKKDVRRVVVLKFNTIYYRLNNNQIEILSFFSNRQDPKKIKL
ncbi:MAG: type II toxin-antitoxin system RelE/ParE family toxin [Bacteroidia bacterium]|jgi:plasmid stabilization system protein ParE|nr:type II toxin-antitoxin system RelE/ParE family toxin [Bacteroidia bacterium]